MAYQITGITRDNTGNLAGSVDVFLLKYDSGTHAFTQVAHVVSNPSTGAFTFSGIADNDPAYNIVAFKDGSPDAFDVSDRNITPTSTLITLEAHWDASVSGSVTEVATKVSQWNDLSGNGHHLTQSVEVNKPVYSGDPKNGLNTMVFDGTPFFLDCSSISIAQRFLIFIVLNNTGSAGELLFDDTTGTSRVIYSADDGSGLQSLYAGTAGPATTTNLRQTWAVMCGDFNGASSAIYYNGTSENTGDVGSSNISSIRLGCRYDGTTLGFSGLIGEIKIYTGSPTGTDIANIVGDLRTKWGI